MILKLQIFFLILLGLCFQTQAFEVPALSGPVMDQVNLLSPQTKNRLEQSIRQLQQTQQIQIQVFITHSLNNEDIASVAIQIFDKWKLGDAKTDKGLLFLIAPNEKKLRIEVGQGLEGDLPDIRAKRIISDIVRPYFQRGEFDLGVLQGVASIQSYVATGGTDLNTEGQQEQVKRTGKKSSGGGTWVFFLLLGLWILIFMISPATGLQILFMVMSGGRGGRGGGGGGWSGGGGSSSGGGASGDW